MTKTFIIDYQDLILEHNPVLSNTGNHCVVFEVVWQNVSWHLWSWQNDIDIQFTEDCLTAYLLSNIIFHNIGVFGKYHCVYNPDMQNSTAMPHLYFQYCVHNNDMRCNWKWFMALLTLTHWGRGKMDATSQTTFSSTYSWTKMYAVRLKFHWSCSHGPN